MEYLWNIKNLSKEEGGGGRRREGGEGEGEKEENGGRRREEGGRTALASEEPCGISVEYQELIEGGGRREKEEGAGYWVRLPAPSSQVLAPRS